MIRLSFYPQGILPVPGFPGLGRLVSLSPSSFWWLLSSCLAETPDEPQERNGYVLHSFAPKRQKVPNLVLQLFGFVVVVSFVRFLLSFQWLVLHISGNWKAELFPFPTANAHYVSFKYINEDRNPPPRCFLNPQYWGGGCLKWVLYYLLRWGVM